MRCRNCQAISASTDFQAQVRSAHLCWKIVNPPVGLPQSDSRPTRSAHTHFFKSIEPFTRLTVGTRRSCVGAGLPPGGRVTLAKRPRGLKSFSTYWESRYIVLECLQLAQSPPRPIGPRDNGLSKSGQAAKGQLFQPRIQLETE